MWTMLVVFGCKIESLIVQAVGYFKREAILSHFKWKMHKVGFFYHIKTFNSIIYAIIQLVDNWVHF